MFTAAHGLSTTCIACGKVWHNCGGVQWLGAQCGKARHKIVWIMFGGGGRMMFRGTLSLEQFLPLWTDSLKQQHSGISTDILLFFRRNYMSQLRALLPLPVAQPMDSVLSPVSTGPGAIRQASSAELVGESPRRTRRSKR